MQSHGLHQLSLRILLALSTEIHRHYSLQLVEYKGMPRAFDGPSKRFEFFQDTARMSFGNAFLFLPTDICACKLSTSASFLIYLRLSSTTLLIPGTRETNLQWRNDRRWFNSNHFWNSFIALNNLIGFVDDAFLYDNVLHK